MKRRIVKSPFAGGKRTYGCAFRNKPWPSKSRAGHSSPSDAISSCSRPASWQGTEFDWGLRFAKWLLVLTTLLTLELVETACGTLRNQSFISVSPVICSTFVHQEAIFRQREVWTLHTPYHWKGQCFICQVPKFHCRCIYNLHTTVLHTACPVYLPSTCSCGEE